MAEIIAGVILDILIGDPKSFPHPVRAMGKLICLEEKIVRNIVHNDLGLAVAGLLIVSINLFIGFFLPFSLLKLLDSNRVLHFLLSSYLVYSCVAARDLHSEAFEVTKALKRSLNEGRVRLSYIVGRDTDKLKEEDIYKALVETVSENTSDGIIAPLFYMMLLGPAGGVAYKFANTMDSMLGYKNHKYRYLGYFPARTDDILNILPSRITSLMMVLTSIGKFDLKNGHRILIRDHYNHKSPNSGWPESAAAGLLGIRLGGGSYYGGVFVDKPFLGDKCEASSEKHVKSVVEIMYRTEIGVILFWILISYLI